MSEKMEYRQFLADVAQVADGDYSTGFKMLGVIVFISQYGADDLLSGVMISPRTGYRWLDTIKTAGWQHLLADVRLKQALRDYIDNALPMPTDIRQTVLQRLEEVLPHVN